MNASASRGSKEIRLSGLSGPIVLVGAGKMGAALLEGWLALGLAANDAVVIEPQPTEQISALASRGLQLNPPSATVRHPAAVVLAVKPQIAPDVIPSVRPYLASN